MKAMWRVAGLMVALAGPAGVVLASESPVPADFAWQGTLELPAGASLARVELPVEALLRLQSSSAQDLRVFNAAGGVVPFAMLSHSDVQRVMPVMHTRSYAAHPLYAGRSASPHGRGAVAVRVDMADAQTHAWVRWDAGAAKGDASPLPAALFDTRAERQTLAAFELEADLPRNALVHVEVASSANLQDWQTLAVKGPLFRFDGPEGPVNTSLELHQPQSLHGRYLRLRWVGQEGVKVVALKGRVASALTTPLPVTSALPAGTPEGSTSLTWQLPFATPIAALRLQSPQDNTLVPVRVLGRMDAAQPWRALASAVVYRLDGQGSSNPPLGLHGASVRTLRVEASGGLLLPAGGLQATLEFEPVQLVFLASGAGPYTLAAGRANTASAAVDAALLGTVAPARLAELAKASVIQVRADPPEGADPWATGWLPTHVTPRSALLWAVLLVGVLALAGVAYTLLRQINARS